MRDKNYKADIWKHTDVSRTFSINSDVLKVEYKNCSLCISDALKPNSGKD